MAEQRIGMIIRRARERRRWTQRELAKAVGVSRATVDAWENDRSYPRNRIGALEDVLGIDLSDTAEPAADTTVREPAGPLDDLKPWQHDWERQVAEEEDLPVDIRRRMVTEWRAARAEARERRRRLQNGDPARAAG